MVAPLTSDQLQALLQHFDAAGVRLVVLFGSVTRASARPDSDVDIALLGGDSWRGLEAGSALAQALGRDPDIVDLATAPEALRFEIARGGVLIYEAEPFLWARFQAMAGLRYFDLKPYRERCAQGVKRRLRREAGLE